MLFISIISMNVNLKGSTATMYHLCNILDM